MLFREVILHHLVQGVVVNNMKLRKNILIIFPFIIALILITTLLIRGTAIIILPENTSIKFAGKIYTNQIEIKKNLFPNNYKIEAYKDGYKVKNVDIKIYLWKETKTVVKLDPAVIEISNNINNFTLSNSYIYGTNLKNNKKVSKINLSDYKNIEKEYSLSGKIIKLAASNDNKHLIAYKTLKNNLNLIDLETLAEKNIPGSFSLDGYWNENKYYTIINKINGSSYISVINTDGTFIEIPIISANPTILDIEKNLIIYSSYEIDDIPAEFIILDIKNNQKIINNNEIIDKAQLIDNLNKVVYRSHNFDNAEIINIIIMDISSKDKKILTTSDKLDFTSTENSVYVIENHAVSKYSFDGSKNEEIKLPEEINKIEKFYVHNNDLIFEGSVNNRLGIYKIKMAN
jgi:hypothetical protein